MKNLLENKVINIINNVNNYERFTTPAQGNFCSCLVYDLGKIRLEKPYNGCALYKVYTDGKHLGNIDSDLITEHLDKMKKRIKTNLINNL